MSLIKDLVRIIEESRMEAEDEKENKYPVRGAFGQDENIVCQGDNLDFLRFLVNKRNMKGQINMIYIDPPFYSKAGYNAVVSTGDNKVKHRAYDDRWEDGMSMYLLMMAKRLRLMKELLADDGLIYVHLDWHVVHYVKILMDEIFGEACFVNEIIWTYKSGGSTKRHFSRKHDNILVYSKGDKYRFYPQKEKSYNRGFKPYRFKGVKEYCDDLGWYTMVNMKDVWAIDMVGRTSAERTGYATQKPELLLERIIESSTREGDLVADFFCGSGTLPAVAGRMGRKFIACDEMSFAVESTVARLKEKNIGFQLMGSKEPQSNGFSVELRANFSDGNSWGKIDLIRVFEENLDSFTDKKNYSEVCKLMEDDSLKMVYSWSIDFDFDGSIFRPTVNFLRKKGKLPTTYEFSTLSGNQICIKIVDIFGNVVLKRIKKNEREH